MSGESEDTPLISVVMPVHNGAPFLTESIGSIQHQTYARIEFIIVDDGSADGSRSIIRDFAARDPGIRPLFLSHRGQSAALNSGIAVAQGQFIAHMEQDDIALPQRLAAQLAWMRSNAVDICGGYLKRFDDENGFSVYPVAHESICRELLFRCALHQGTSLVRAEIAQAHRFDERVVHTDYEMLTRLAPRYRLGNLPQVVLRHRRHAHQANVVFGVAFNADTQKFRRPYFHTLFPQATAADYAALARVANKETINSIAELTQAGDWLVRLAQLPDAFLRRQMAARWLAACRASTHLGLGTFRLYRKVAPQFDVPTDRAAELWLACALRINPGSRVEQALRRVRHNA